MIAKDKIVHFVCGFLLSILGVLVWPLYGLGFVMGVAKEIWDASGHGTPEWADLWYTWAGAMLAAAVGGLLCLM